MKVENQEYDVGKKCLDKFQTMSGFPFPFHKNVVCHF